MVRQDPSKVPYAGSNPVRVSFYVPTCALTASQTLLIDLVVGKHIIDLTK